MANPDQVCRLCLNPISDTFETLDHHTVEMLENISLSLDLSLTDNPLVCFDCRDNLQQSYDFKMTCLNNAYHVGTLFNCDSNVEIDRMGNTTQTMVKRDVESSCRFCSKYYDNDSFVKFNVEEDGFLKDMLHKCLPEIEPNITNDLLICYVCMKNCQNMFNLVINCLNTEEKVKKHIQTNGTTSSGKINLSDAIKFEQDLKDHSKTVETNINFIKQEVLIDSVGGNSCGTVDTFEDVKGDGILKETLNYTNCDVVVKQEALEQLEEDNIDIKCEDDFLFKTEMPIQENCSQENTESTGMNKTVHKCTHCSYESPHKAYLKTHMLSHGTSKVKIFACSLCSYVGKAKDNLRKHMLVHKDTSEVVMHKCTQCDFTSKYTGSVRKHALIHKDKSEVTMYKCTECDYENRYKKNLTHHLLVHKDRSEINMHKCTECDFQSKRARSLLRHKVIHQTGPNVTMHKCTQCNFESKHKQSLSDHMLNHKDYSEITMHKCTQCEYWTKHKRNLLNHMVIHEEMPEGAIFRCEHCSYESKHKKYLEYHMTSHKEDSEVTWYKCTVCSYQTKRKDYLRKHAMRHRDKSSFHLYKCAECKFETRYRRSIGSHVLLHKNNPGPPFKRRARQKRSI